MSTYPWINLHRETVKKLLTYRDRQDELIGLFRTMQDKGLKPILLNDQNPKDKIIPLNEIDPFTFLATFNRGIKDANRVANWKFLADEWNLRSEIPADFPGIPIANNQNAWWISYAYHRDAKDVPLLWDLAEAAYQTTPEDLDRRLFDDCLAIRGVALAKLTMGLFWINPSEFVACDKKNLSQARSLGITSKPHDALSYLTWVEALKSKNVTNFVEFSAESHQLAIHSLGHPFDDIFQSYEEADTILDLFRDVLEVVYEHTDEPNRILSLSSRKRGGRGSFLRINIGMWAAFSVCNHRGKVTIETVLQSDHSEAIKRDRTDSFSEKPDGQSYALVPFEPDYFFNHYGELWPDIENAIVACVKVFLHYKRSPFHRTHRPELIELFMDSDKRQSYLTNGLPLSDEDNEAEQEDHQPPPDSAPEKYTREDALAELFMHGHDLDNILAQLKRKKNIILQGAPGVGKTFIAKRLAWLQMGFKDTSRINTVQFHQSFTYEDFVQGLRPRKKGGFEIKNGIFYQLCRQAQADIEQDYFLIIDEINRGNLSKILGELMMLIECDKRGDEEATLLYSEGETFTVPENLYLIGTMNTADRSLSLVDYALRRRFAFLNLKPGFETESFATMLNDNGVDIEGVTRIRSLMAQLNEEISKDTLNLGDGFCIGHSFFTPTEGLPIEDFDVWLMSILQYEIAPLLDEYWVDDPEKSGTLKSSILNI